VVCPTCKSSIPDDSDFCARCGSPVRLKLPQEETQIPSSRRLIKRIAAITLVLAATAAFIGLVLWDGSSKQEPQQDSTALPYSTREAISRCDAMAQAKLYLPETMESVGGPEAYDFKTTLSVARNIAAKDKYGKRYRYRYICTATADGQGGWTGFSVELMPTND
jgi:hypothetical protein